MNAKHAALAAITATSILTAIAVSPLRINLTDSVPHGLWIERPTNGIERGMLVTVCPPDLPIVRERMIYGKCPGVNVRPLFKAIGALPGDTVSLRKGILASVNGTELPNTTAVEYVPAWPDGNYIVPNDEVWIFSTYTPRSFDSRYFGPVKIANVIGKAEPVLIDGNPRDVTKGMSND